ncbi:MAG: MBL fold metallo-hydrolase [Phycisphaerales bacterium]
MTIHMNILGEPGRDNALLLRIESGQSVTRLLFDCGDGCLQGISFGEIQAINHLFLSHCHMDHIGGFDSFFRCTFERETPPNNVWGPPGVGAILQHRFQGFWWNLHQGMRGSWLVHDIHEDRVDTARFELNEAFEIRHDAGKTPHTGVVVATPDFTVRALQLEHHGPCLGYLVTESAKRNIDTAKAAQMGLRPGRWMSALKSADAAATIEIEGRSFAIDALKRDLLTEIPGASIAYLTDFHLDAATEARLADELRGCNTLVCEAQYRHADAERASKNHHTTTKLVGQLAARAGVGKLVLMHLSERYPRAEWAEMLGECRELFPMTELPSGW